MRSSVPRQTQRAATRRRRLRIALLLTLAAALCTLLLAYTNWRVNADIHKREAAQNALFADIDARVARTLAERVETARQAEAAARAGSAQNSALREAAATANPAGTVPATAACGVTELASITVVINKKHCFDPLDWQPSDLTAVNGWYLRAEAANRLQALIDAAAVAGQPLTITSAYRSYTDQATTYAEWIRVKGTQAAADSLSARPGYSEHQTGLAVDFKTNGCALECFAATSQYAWLTAHAAEYGFIRRYPDGLTSITGYEPEAWHWRYVGSVIAQDMKTKGIETLEMYFRITGGDYAN